MGVLKPELIFKSIVPIIMAGILGIYGLIVSVILSGKSKFSPLFNSLLTPPFTIVGASEGSSEGYTEAMGYKHLASGLCCGLSSLVIILSSYWAFILGCWSRYRYCWWCRSQSKRPTGPDLRWYDSDPYLRWGSRSIWYDYCHYPLPKLNNWSLSRAIITNCYPLSALYIWQ